MHLGLTVDQWNYQWPNAAPMRPASPWSRYGGGASLIPPHAIPSDVLVRWQTISQSHPGYNNARGCYCWGHKPPLQRPSLGRLAGLGGGLWDGGTVDPATGEPWYICPDGCPQAPPPAASCPPVMSCPLPPPCPPSGIPAPCPTCPTAPVKAEIDIFWIAGAAALGIAAGFWWKGR